MRSAKLPKPTKSKNPVVILKHVIKAIQEEPKRYDQAQLIERRGEVKDREMSYYPSCGTVGCVAGWTVILTGGSTSGAVLGPAQHRLGLSPDEAQELFNVGPDDVRYRCEVTPRQHAADGIKHIKRFVLKKWGKKI